MRVYNVIPLTPALGLVEWVNGCSSLNEILLSDKRVCEGQWCLRLLFILYVPITIISPHRHMHFSSTFTLCRPFIPDSLVHPSQSLASKPLLSSKIAPQSNAYKPFISVGKPSLLSSIASSWRDILTLLSGTKEG